MLKDLAMVKYQNKCKLLVKFAMRLMLDTLGLEITELMGGFLKIKLGILIFLSRYPFA